MIDTIEVLNLPYEGTKWKRGDVIKAQEKNVLFIGDNRTGKTTMLRNLHQSLVNSSLFNKWETHLPEANNPYGHFIGTFDGESYKFEPYLPEHKLATKQELLDAFTDAVQAIFGDGRNHIWDPRYTSSYGNFMNVQQKFIDDCSLREGHISNVLHVANGGFIDAIELYAKKHKLDTSVIYGNLITMYEGTYSLLDNNVSRWGGYLRLEGSDIDESPIVSSFSEHAKESEGQKSMRLIDLISPRAIAILDEPSNGLSIKNAAEYLEKLKSAVQTQIFASTHDQRILDIAKSQPKNWKVYDLDTKKYVK